ncbi:MAG: molybdate transport system ATP-binding protein [Desulforhopalus sp.]|jgi:molybdate transport system ATP-binding protein
MHIVHLEHPQLTIDHLKTEDKQSWCFYGENGSGIDRFLQLLEGRLTDFSATTIEIPANPGLLSFRLQQEIFEEELRNDDSDFMDRMDPGTTAAAFLGSPEKAGSLIKAFNLEPCLNTGFRQLSSGQCRKLIMLREVLRGTRVIILQNPYDGLDAGSCSELNHALSQLADQEITIIILLSNTSDIPAWCSHIGIFSGPHLTHSGPRATVLTHLKTTASPLPPTEAPITQKEPTDFILPTDPENELIRLKNGFAGYGGTTLFEGLNLDVFEGDHTLIYGPNGCGKSTLLDMITGDNTKCYANDLRMFGKRRGGGESIWELKHKMGIVSPSLHRDHRVPGTALHVTLSGLFDSIGLYEKVSTVQIKQARRWLSWLELSHAADTPFRRLEFSEQRLILIGRALIKKPRLLVFDEATQGLDDKNRHKLLNLLDRIASDKLSTILFVSHRTDEYRPFFTQKIKLDAYNV